MQLAFVERDSEGQLQIKLDLTDESFPYMFAALMWEVLQSRAGALKRLTYADVLHAVRYTFENLKKRSVEVG